MATSHYVGEPLTVDVAAGGGAAQLTLTTIMEAVGTPLREKKRQVMEELPTFLGHVNDLQGVPTRHETVGGPQPEREDKVVGIVEATKASGKCTLENAAKLRGLTQVYGNAMHGKIARGCKQALTERQHSGSDDRSLNQTVKNVLDHIESWQRQHHRGLSRSGTTDPRRRQGPMLNTRWRRPRTAGASDSW